MTRNKDHLVAIILFIVICLLGCSEKKSINCESIDQDVTIYFGRKFENEKVVVSVDGRIVFEDVVSTDRSTEVAANTTITGNSGQSIAIILSDSDTVNVCPRPFIIVNRIAGQVEIETYDTLPKLRFL